MKKVINFFMLLLLLLASPRIVAWEWMDLWKTPDQQGAVLLQAGNFKEAAGRFENKNWQNVAQYRAENYLQAEKAFSQVKTSDGQYNAGNAAAFAGRYKESIQYYDKAIALNANNTDAITNRDIIKKLLQKKDQQKNSNQSKNEKQEKQNQSKNEKQEKQNQSGEQKQQNTAQNNSSQQNQDKKEPGQENQNQDNNANKDKQQSNQNKDTPQQPQSQEPQSASLSKKEEENKVTQKQVPQAEEERKQILRRIADDPGGLLRQKFLRDYYRRHNVSDNADEGDM